MLYNPGEIAMIRSTIENTVKKMDTELDSVEAKCKPLEGEAFEGAAQTSYLESKQVWREAALEIAQVMNRLALAVSESGDSMASADKQAASWFQG
ncbi:MAG: WXG100 family type VII secretion target [Micromonosporaceae bacterium]